MTNEKDKPSSAPDVPDQPVAGSSSEDVKRKFRAALDKKHAHGGRNVAEDGDQAKIHDAHGPAKAQQMFRRKSGG